MSKVMPVSIPTASTSYRPLRGLKALKKPYLLQAEVIRRQVSAVIRDTYPVIFGDAMNFTLPMGAEGVSVEAELNGEPI